MDAHDHGNIPDDPLQFQEAIDRFRARVPMTDEQFEQLQDAEREFAFTVANVAQADLVAQVYEAIASAIEDGTTLDDFKAEVGGALADAWGGDDPAHLENIFRTNVMESYNDGRYDVLTAPATLAARPYWRYEGIDDGRACEICEPCIGVILPADHPWWRTHYPILHYLCRDIVSPLSEDEAKDEGITGSPPDGPPALEGFGTPPSGAGDDWEPDTADYPAAIGDELADKLAETG